MISDPLDRHSACRDLFGEIDQRYDVERLARPLIPEGPDAAGTSGGTNVLKIILRAVAPKFLLL